eukprot:1398770-Rhodomonas_salina.1
MAALQALAAASPCVLDADGQSAGHICAAQGTAAAFQTLCLHLKGFGPLQVEGHLAAPLLMAQADARVVLPQRWKAKVVQKAGGAAGSGGGGRESTRTGHDGERSSDQDAGGGEKRGRKMEGRTALEVALVAGNTEVVGTVCSEGWRLACVDAQGGGVQRRRLALALCAGSRWRGLVPAVVMQDAATALLEEGAGWPDEVGEELVEVLAGMGKAGAEVGGEALLVREAGRGGVAALSRLLERSGAEAADLKAEAMAQACREGQAEAVRVLLEHGASVDGVGREERRVLWR